MLGQRVWGALILCGTFCSATGTVWQFDISGRATSGLSAANEVPSVSSLATGREMAPGITYDDSTHLLDLHFAWGSHPAVGGTDLTGDFSSAFIQGPAGTNSSSTEVLYDITPQATPADASRAGRTGSVNYSFTLADTTLNGNSYPVQDQEQDLLSGLWYLNVTSSQFEGGEIRGQLTPVPEPSEYAALSAAALFVFALVKRARLAGVQR